MFGFCSVNFLVKPKMNVGCGVNVCVHP